MEQIQLSPGFSDMTWSFSRLKAFDQCKYGWFLKYLLEVPKGEPQFFASFGSFAHSLLADYLSGKLRRRDLAAAYLTGFSARVPGGAPSSRVFASYFDDGLRYFQNPAPFPFEILAVEQKIRFEIDGLPFVGFVDVIGREEDGLVVLDHKSRALKPPSGRKKPTLDDKMLSEYFVQLYLYSVGVKNEFKMPVKYLEMNIFRKNLCIKSQFDADAFEQAKKWAVETVKAIDREQNFEPNVDFFQCKYLCDVKDHCDYYKINFERG